MEKIRKCLYLEQDLFKALKQVKEIEAVKENRIYEEFLTFALNAYSLVKDNNLNIENMDEYFKKGVEMHGHNKTRDNINSSNDDNIMDIKS